MTRWQIFALTAVSTIGLSTSTFIRQAQARPMRPTSIAQTNSCYQYAGDSALGQAVTVNLCSISQIGDQQVNFTYHLDDEPIASRADCTDGSWTTFPERQPHLPRSRATESMIGSVCRAVAEIAVVFAPPSNVRAFPDGPILCTLEQEGSLSTYGSTNSWHYTNACGTFGVIHSSQIRF